MPHWTVWYVALYWWFFLPCVLLSCLVWGDRVLRQASIAYAVCVVLGDIGLSRAMYVNLEYLQATTDTALTVFLLALSLAHRRWWLMTATGLQLTACLGHVARYQHQLTRLGYALMTGVGGYPILIVFGMAVLLPVRRRRGPGSPPATISRVAIRPR